MRTHRTADSGDAPVGIGQPQDGPSRQRCRTAAYGNHLGPSLLQTAVSVSEAGPCGSLHREGHVWAGCARCADPTRAGCARCADPTRAGCARCADPTRAGCARCADLDHHGPPLPQAGTQAPAVSGGQPHAGSQQDHIDAADEGVQHLGCCVAGFVHEHPPVQRCTPLGHRRDAHASQAHRGHPPAGARDLRRKSRGQGQRPWALGGQHRPPDQPRLCQQRDKIVSDRQQPLAATDSHVAQTHCLCSSPCRHRLCRHRDRLDEQSCSQTIVYSQRQRSCFA